MENLIVTTYSKQDILEIFKEALTAFFAENKGLQEAPPAVDQRFSITGLAKYLNVSLSTVYTYKKNGVLPVHQTGRTVYFIQSEIDQWLASHDLKKYNANK